jgi:hypothetical protein
MILVISLLFFSSFFFLLSEILGGNDIETLITTGTKLPISPPVKISGFFSNTCFGLAMWFFCFKYWQTAVDLD